MTARGAIIGMAACGLIWAAAGTAAAQELQAGQIMTQSEADRLEAVQADLDRMEAEEADEEMRDEERRRRRRARERLEEELLDDVREDTRDEEQREIDREEYEDWSRCLARLPAQQAVMMEQVLAQHALAVQSIRDSAGAGANVAAAIQQQDALRDQLIAAIAGETCG